MNGQRQLRADVARELRALIDDTHVLWPVLAAVEVAASTWSEAQTVQYGAVVRDALRTWTEPKP